MSFFIDCLSESETETESESEFVFGLRLRLRFGFEGFGNFDPATVYSVWVKHC